MNRLVLVAVAMAVCGCTANFGIYPGSSGGDSSTGGGWQGLGTVPCSAGRSVTIACGCGVGSCTGDPVLRICSATSSTSSCASGVGVLGENDDCSGLCPGVSITCPSSGLVTALVRGYGGNSFTCSLGVR